MPQRILGLDIGAWSVKGVVLESFFRGYRVIDAQEVVIPPGPPEERRELRLRAVRELLGGEPCSKTELVVTALPGEQSTSRFIPLPYSDHRKVDATIVGELADLIPIDVDEAIVDHTILQKTADGGSVSFAIAVPKVDVSAHLELLSEAGVNPRFLSVDIAQLYNLYTHFLKEDQSRAEEPGTPATEASTFIIAAPDGPPPARVIVDIGHERTLVAACGENGLALVRVLRHGGRDVSKAIEAAFGVSLEEAEELKHTHGFVASSRQPPPSEAEERMSDAVRSGLHALVQDLRRTLLSVRTEKRVHVSRIDLLGGGSRIRNLSNHLAEELNVPCAMGLAAEQIVERQVEPARRPAFALALSLALRAAGDRAVSPIDLRREEFQFAGQLQSLRSRIPAILASGAVLGALLVANIWLSYYSASAREKALDQRFCQITNEAIGREICEPKQALSVMAQPVSELGNVRTVERSALEIAAELSARIPEEVSGKPEFRIDEIDITPDRARITGETDTYDAVDQIVAEYSKDPCYSNIKKGQLRRKADGKGIEFQLSLRLECSS